MPNVWLREREYVILDYILMLFISIHRNQERSGMLCNVKRWEEKKKEPRKQNCWQRKLKREKQVKMETQKKKMKLILPPLRRLINLMVWRQHQMLRTNLLLLKIKEKVNRLSKRGVKDRIGTVIF
jgi:hypothetical protein